MLMIAALMLGCTGVFCLRVGWRKAGIRFSLIPLGWLIIALSSMAWVEAVGAELGFSYSLICLTLAAWVIIIFGIEQRSKKESCSVLNTSTLKATSLCHKLITFLIAGPLAGGATCVATVAITRAMPFSTASQMVIALFTYPLIWGATTYWHCARNRPVLDTFVLCIVAVVSLLYLFV